MMKKSILGTALIAAMCMVYNPSQAQFKLNTKAIGKAASGAAESAASDIAANKVSSKLVDYMDNSNKVAAADSKFAKRLDSLTGKYATVNGLSLNYKVYENEELNVLACANGSIRVYSGAMNTFNNEELMAIIAHQIGHIANKDARDALMKAASGDNAGKASSAQMDKILSMSGDKLGTLTNELIQTPYNSEQETAADNYAYTFLKGNGEKAVGLISALEKINKIDLSSEGTEEASAAAKFSAVHPNSSQRAEALKSKARKDGLL